MTSVVDPCLMHRAFKPAHACLWQQRGKRQDAYDLLAPLYGWFTEYFDTADLQEAAARLEAYSR